MVKIDFVMVVAFVNCLFWLGLLAWAVVRGKEEVDRAMIALVERVINWLELHAPRIRRRLPCVRRIAGYDGPWIARVA